jgi:hypothetical protein
MSTATITIQTVDEFGNKFSQAADVDTLPKGTIVQIGTKENGSKVMLLGEPQKGEARNATDEEWNVLQIAPERLGIAEVVRLGTVTTTNS